MMRRHGDKDGLSTFVGLLDAQAYQRQGEFSGVRYGYHIGYVWMICEWFEGTDRLSWFEHPSIYLPRINDRWRDRLGWRARQFLSESKHLLHHFGGTKPEG
ncbi:hypothetical protein [Arthrobacter sp. ZGTC131]|uniref:hypothetical protein n=1 Tax=Arthrobacter sp. ZGTC131 TaxID=2058898 RepID=UPI0011AFE85A|nr:hypothetical protein [Arthrobacter sp. ZGTC131]